MILKCLIILPFIGFTNTQNSYKVTCDGIIFNHAYYDRKILVGNYGRPCNLMYHRYGSTIYFSHTVKKNDDEVDFTITSCNVMKKKCIDISEVPGGYAIGYDAGNDDIYFGGHDGLYKFNFAQNRAHLFAEKGHSVWGLFIRKNFYYIEYPSQRLLVYRDFKFAVVAEARNFEIDQFFVSRFGDVYFANKTGLFKVIRPTRDMILLNEDLVIRQIAEDNYGDLYFCAHDGIYIENKPYDNLKKVADIDDAYGVAFDEKDHLIYSDKDTIYRIEPSPNAELCYNALKSQQEAEVKRNYHVMSD